MATYITDIIPDHISGDTFPGRAYTILINGIAPSLVGSIINMQIGHVIFSNTTGEIEVTDVGKFQIKEQIITLPLRTHEFEIVITFASGKVKTYIKGMWKING